MQLEKDTMYGGIWIAACCHFRMYIDGRLRAAADTLQQMQQQIAESKKRFEVFYALVEAIQVLLTSLGRREDTYLKEIQRDKTLRKVGDRVSDPILSPHAVALSQFSCVHLSGTLSAASESSDWWMVVGFLFRGMAHGVGWGEWLIGWERGGMAHGVGWGGGEWLMGWERGEWLMGWGGGIGWWGGVGGMARGAGGGSWDGRGVDGAGGRAHGVGVGGNGLWGGDHGVGVAVGMAHEVGWGNGSWGGGGGGGHITKKQKTWEAEQLAGLKKKNLIQTHKSFKRTLFIRMFSVRCLGPWKSRGKGGWDSAIPTRPAGKTGRSAPSRIAVVRDMWKIVMVSAQLTDPLFTFNAHK